MSKCELIGRVRVTVLNDAVEVEPVPLLLLLEQSVLVRAQHHRPLSIDLPLVSQFVLSLLHSHRVRQTDLVAYREWMGAVCVCVKETTTLYCV